MLLKKEVRSNSKPVLLKIETQCTSDLFITGRTNDDVLFSRIAKPFNNTYLVGVPHTETFFDVLCYPRVGQQNFNAKIEILPLKTKLIADRKTVDFVNFVIPFAYDFKKKAMAKYTANGFSITVFPKIEHTSTRIRKNSPDIEISKYHFDRMTVAERAFWLFHEYAHNFLNQTPENEIEADFWAAQIHNEVGYPIIEANNAVLDLNNQADDIRYQNIVNTLNDIPK